jgi:hypothetical protein
MASPVLCFICAVEARKKIKGQDYKTHTPSTSLNPSRRSKNQRLGFNEGPWSHGPAAIDSVHKTVDLFHRIFFSKIIPTMLKITGALEFYKNTIELF